MIPTVVIILAAISMTKSARATELKTLLEFPPATLNPRLALDATGQRLNMLLFRGLTMIDQNLQVQPDLAESWKIEAGGKKWVIQLRPNQFDQEKAPITAKEIKKCVDNYLNGKPLSPLKASFSQWEKITARSDRELIIELKAPDPYLMRNLSLLRFFRIQGQNDPCKNPETGDQVIGSGNYRLTPWNMNPDRTLTLVSQDPKKSDLRFEIIKDETSRLLKLLKGDVDFLQNSFSPTKTDWIMKNHPARFRLIERGGVNVSYMAFNLNDPVLSVLKVRQAIALSIDRQTIINALLKNFGTKAGSFLSPELPGSTQSEFVFDPLKAETLLEEAGFKKDSQGIRFHLKYKTTPSKDGFEAAQVFQSMLKKVGIQLDLEMVDPAVFFSSIRKGNFQIYSSRWVGISDPSILQRTLLSTHADNRVHYNNPEVDQALKDLSPENLRFVQNQMAKDLPYFTLWFWSNSMIMRKEIQGLEGKDLSLSGSFVPWSSLKKVNL